MAKLRQRTGTPFEIRRGEVAQDERALRQMPGREGRFEPGLSAQQPIHGAVQGIRVCRFDMQDRAQARRRGVRTQAAGRGQLRLRGQETSDDHGQNQLAMLTFLGRDEPIYAQATYGT